MSDDLDSDLVHWIHCSKSLRPIYGSCIHICGVLRGIDVVWNQGFDKRAVYCQGQLMSVVGYSLGADVRLDTSLLDSGSS